MGKWGTLKSKMFGGDSAGGSQNALKLSMEKVMDQMAVNFVSNRYPPTTFLKPEEFMVYGNAANQLRKEEEVEPEMVRKDELINRVEDGDNRRSVVNGESEVRLVDPQWMRIVKLKDVGMDLEAMESMMEMDAKEEGEQEGGGKNGSVDNQMDNLLVYHCVSNDHKILEF